MTLTTRLTAGEAVIFLSGSLLLLAAVSSSFGENGFFNESFPQRTVALALAISMLACVYGLRKNRVWALRVWQGITALAWLLLLAFLIYGIHVITTPEHPDLEAWQFIPITLPASLLLAVAVIFQTALHGVSKRFKGR